MEGTWTYEGSGSLYLGLRFLILGLEGVRFVIWEAGGRKGLHRGLRGFISDLRLDLGSDKSNLGSERSYVVTIIMLQMHATKIFKRFFTNTRGVFSWLCDVASLLEVVFTAFVATKVHILGILKCHNVAPSILHIWSSFCTKLFPPWHSKTYRGVYRTPFRLLWTILRLQALT